MKKIATCHTCDLLVAMMIEVALILEEATTIAVVVIEVTMTEIAQIREVLSMTSTHHPPHVREEPAPTATIRSTVHLEEVMMINIVILEAMRIGAQLLPLRRVIIKAIEIEIIRGLTHHVIVQVPAAITKMKEKIHAQIHIIKMIVVNHVIIIKMNERIHVANHVIGKIQNILRLLLVHFLLFLPFLSLSLI